MAAPFKFIAIAMLLVLATPALASAEWFISPFIGLKFASSTNIVDLEQGAGNTKMTLGIAAAIMSDKVLGVEAELGHSPRFFERSGGSDLVASSDVTTLMGNVILAVPRSITRESLRPYAVVGAGLLHVAIKDRPNVLPVNKNLVGLSIGGGAIGQLTNRTSVRFEVRHIRNIPRGRRETPGFGDTELSFWRATVGIALLGSLF